MSRINVLSDADVAILRELIARERGRPRASARPAQQHIPPQAPEVYVIRTPTGGLPPLLVQASGSVVVSQVECPVYRRNTDTNILVSIGVTREVGNISCDVIPENTYCLIARDKWGSWYVTEVGCETEGTVFTCDNCTGSGTGTSDLPDFVCSQMGISPDPNACNICSEWLQGVTLSRDIGLVGRSCLYRYCQPVGGSYCIQYLGAFTQAYACVEFYFDTVPNSPTINKWVLTLSVYGDQNIGSAIYTADSWDCASTLTLTKFVDVPGVGNPASFDACADFNEEITWPSTTTIVPGLCIGTGTGTGTSGSSGIQMNGVGSAQAQSTNTLTIPNVTVEAGLIVVVLTILDEGVPGVATVTYGGSGLTPNDGISGVFGSNAASVRQYYIPVGSADTQDIVVTTSETDISIMVQVINITGLVDNAPDTGVSYGSGSGTPTTGTPSNPTTTPDCALLTAFLLDTTSSFGWSGGYTSGSQDVIDSTNGVTATEGRRIVSAAGTYYGSLSGISTTYIGVQLSYK